MGQISQIIRCQIYEIKFRFRNPDNKPCLSRIFTDQIRNSRMIWIDQIRIYFIHTVYGKDKNIFRGEGGLEFGQVGEEKFPRGTSPYERDGDTHRKF